MNLPDPDDIIPQLSYRQRKLLFDISMFNFRAQSMKSVSWGYVHIWKNKTGWQERKLTRLQVRPLIEKGLVTLRNGALATTVYGYAVVKRLEEMKAKGFKQSPSLIQSDSDGQFLMHF